MGSILEYLVHAGKSKQESEVLIRSGKVRVNEEVVFTPSVKVKNTDKVRLTQTNKWVSRGALKLLPFLEQVNVSFQGKVVLDVGSSTGGFTQVALSKGAKKVYALDVGTNQLDYALRKNPRVVVMEKTNLKSLHASMFQDKINIVLVDVSFISLKSVFRVLQNGIANSKMQVIALIKPQFEADSNQVQEGGVVPENLHETIIKKVAVWAQKNSFLLVKVVKSQMKGKKKHNQEHFGLFVYEAKTEGA